MSTTPHSFQEYCETCAAMICKEPDKKGTDTGSDTKVEGEDALKIELLR